MVHLKIGSAPLLATYHKILFNVYNLIFRRKITKMLHITIERVEETKFNLKHIKCIGNFYCLPSYSYNNVRDRYEFLEKN